METSDIKYAIGDLRRAGNTKKRIAEFLGIKVSDIHDIPIPSGLEELILSYHEVGHNAQKIASFTSISEEMVSLLIERSKSREKY